MKLHPAARKFADIPARFYERTTRREIPVTSLQITTVPPGTPLSPASIWTTVPVSNRRATIYLVGPDAGGPAVGVTVPVIAVPPTGLDLYVRPNDTLESDPVYTERITLS